MIIQKSFAANQVIAISQTAHAWVSGQLARQWGNESFLSFAPVEPLCYAAEQHDRGFLDWERQPMLNPRSGLPHTFENIPLRLDVELRKKSILELKAVSLYAALVTSLYFTGAVGKQSSVENEEDHQKISEFLREQEALQRKLLRSLRRDPYLRSACSDRAIEYNRGLLAAWDQLSVQLCREPDSKFSVNDVPTALEKTCRLSVTPIDPNSREIGLEPWPFSKPRVELSCEGHVLDRRFTSEADLRRYLKDARRVSVLYTLIPSTQTNETMQQ
jgi:Protein of unknown function (DUF3891)